MPTRLFTIIALTVGVMTMLAAPVFAGWVKAEQYTVPLSGDQVVPGPGDPDAEGDVDFSIRRDGVFCWFSDTTNLSVPITAVHLHRAAAGAVDPTVLVELYGRSASDPDPSGCHDLDPALGREISRDRAQFYIDIHNEEFPAGAARAQLSADSVGASTQR